MKIFTFRYIPIFFILTSLFILTSCSNDDDPEDIHGEEEINRVVLQITSDAGTETYTWNETGTSNTAIQLAANSTYQVAVAFYDASDASDVENITEEVIEEADEHQVFYGKVGIASNLTIASRTGDTLDSDNNPVLINTQWTTAEASTGTVRVYLIHEPTSKTGESRDDFGGEIDVEVDFSIEIE